MKKALSLLLAAIILIGVTACGSEASSDTTTENTTLASTDESVDNTPAIFKKGSEF